MTTSTEKSFFDLHITGLGYLNRIREVKPKKGDAFLACDIAALNGPSDDVAYVRFDTRVSGSAARCAAASSGRCREEGDDRLPPGRPVDRHLHLLQGQACRRAGVSLKARLLFVSWIKVDGKLVYKAEPKPTDADDRDERDVRNTDVPATSAEPQAATPEPSRPAAEAADEAAADAPHWKLPSRSDPQGPVPGALSSPTRVRMRPSP